MRSHKSISTRNCWIIITLAATWTHTSWAAGFSAKGYELKPSASAAQPLLFTLDNTRTGETGTTVFKDSKGRELIEEKMRYDPQGALVEYEIHHRQRALRGKIEVRSDKLIFTRVDEKGKSSTEQENLPVTWAVGPTLIPLLQKNWATILKGEKLRIRFAVWDRKETVGFDLFKDSVQPGGDGKDHVIVKMKPTSFIIAAIVDPIYFTLPLDGSRLEEMKGRTLPMIERDGKLRDLDAWIVYQNTP